MTPEPMETNRAIALRVAAARAEGGPLEGDPAVALDILDMIGVLGPRDESGKWTISDVPLVGHMEVKDTKGNAGRRSATPKLMRKASTHK